jgi:hypothetical protein
MEPRTNLPALASMASGLATVATVLAAFCAGMLPFGLTLALVTLPVQLATASAALVFGIAGYRVAGRRGGVGNGAALGGLGIGATWYALQIAGWGLFGAVLAITKLL